MSIEQLRQECYSVVQESNERWKGIPQKLKEAKIPSPPVKQGYPVSVCRISIDKRRGEVFRNNAQNGGEIVRSARFH